MSGLEWAHPAAAIFVGYLVLGITGFGSALVIVPLLAWKWPLPEVVALAILLDVPLSALHGWLNLPQVRWRAVAQMLPGMAVGSLLGLWLLGQLDKRWPLFVLGVYIAGVGLRALRQAAAPARPLSPAGMHGGSVLVGMIEVLFATPGPVVLAMLQRRLGSVADVRATVPVVMVAAGAVAIAMLAGSGQLDSGETLWRWLLALPIATAGVVLGNWLARRIPAPVMRRTLAVLLVASGLSLTRHLWL